MLSVGGEIIDIDNGYGPVNARNLDKNLALLNADSYAYFASVSGHRDLQDVLVSYIMIGAFLVRNLLKELCRPASGN